MTLDPYPDLPDSAPAGDGGEAEERPELSEADSRLLAALSQPEPPVVTAVEDQPRTTRAAQDDGVVWRPTAGRGSPLAPVFREPTG